MQITKAAAEQLILEANGLPLLRTSLDHFGPAIPDSTQQQDSAVTSPDNKSGPPSTTAFPLSPLPDGSENSPVLRTCALRPPGQLLCYKIRALCCISSFKDIALSYELGPPEHSKFAFSCALNSIH